MKKNEATDPEVEMEATSPDSAEEAVVEPRDDEAHVVQQEFSENIQRILDLQLPVTVSFGMARKPLAEVLKLAPGSLVELDKSASDPVLLKVNDKVFAWGKVVDVDGYYGVEITEIIARVDRIASLGGI
jgi:flagellar motor switch protein FliN/FliY